MPCYRRKLKKGWRWFYSGQYLGFKYFSKAIYLTKSECGKAERIRIKELDQHARNPNQDMRLWDLIQFRLDDLQIKKSVKYYKENARYLKMLYENTGDINFSEVRKSTINKILQDFSKDLAKRGKTNHKVNAMLRCLKALFNYGLKVYDLDIKNPCDRLDYYPVDKNLKYIPTNEEIEAVLKNCDDDQRFLIAFILETGARINEALRFSAKDILGDEIVLYTRKSKNSNLQPRKIPKPLCLQGLTFKGRLFKSWTFYPEFLKRKVRKLGHSYWNFHNLRHRYASRLSKEGRPLFEIMMLLGHSNLSTTQGYLQLLP